MVAPMTPEELREWRTARHLTQQQFADLVGVKRRAVLYWEKGGRKIPPTVEKLLQAL